MSGWPIKRTLRRRGAHRSVRELKTAIREFIDAHH